MCLEVGTRVLAAAADAVRDRGRFAIVLAGGNTPRGLYHWLAARQAQWSAWHLYYGDERCTPVDDVARNSRMAALAWVDRVPIPRDQVHAIPGELGPYDGAARYIATLSGVPTFDLVLLGLGEDGHTASLFPGHDWGITPASPVALPVIDAPKPPPARISLSARRLSDTRAAFFLVTGEDKRDAVRAWHDGEPIPAGSIAPPAGVDIYVEAALLDPAAR